MIVKDWIWRPLIAGLAGTVVHFLFMYFKSRAGLFPSFQPYHTLQFTLNRWVGTDVPSFVPWALSFVNGMAILGFLFARLYQLLPGRNGATKGLAFGLIGWMLMGLIFFPVIGLGPFAFGAGLGIAPTLLSLAMLLTYSVVLGTVYAALDTWPPRMTWLMVAGLVAGAAGAASAQTHAHGHTGQPAPHSAGSDTSATREFRAAHARMMRNMAMPFTGDVDLDFRMHMIPHHQGAIDMARVALRHAKDAWTRQAAQAIIIGSSRKFLNFKRGWRGTEPWPLPVGSHVTS